jgi:hypothetical protein
MLEMLVIANSAFAVIKQTLENGKELASAGNAISRFVSAEDKLQQDLAEARKQRKEARIKTEKRKQQIKDTILKVILVILITALLSGVVTVLAIIARKKGII